MYVNRHKSEDEVSRTGERPGGPRRRPATGGYARGDEKRSRIIEAAVRRFGEDGYEGASTRQIAQDAGVNPPALQYYFDSKEGLYAACLRHIADGFSAAMRPVYERSAGVAPGDAEAALAVFCDLLDAVADFLFETAEANGWRRFYARARARDDGLERIDRSATKALVENELFGHCFRLVATATGGSPASPGTRLRALLAMGPLTAFHLERDGMLTRLGWPDLRGSRLTELKRLLRRQVGAALGRAADPVS